MFRRFLVAAVVVLALVSSATAGLPAAAKTNKAATILGRWNSPPQC
jgi:hypothetical protein